MRKRHPLGLYILFLTELWERFGFYCMLAIFKLYMTDKNNGHPFLQEHSNQIYGLYLGGVYFTPFFGGILAEWKWGYRLTIILGALFLGAGYLLLGANSLTIFAVGLGAIIVGNGLFKPNISTMVGKLYPAGDPRVDNAFTIFYMGINIGAFTSPLVAGFLSARYGYQVGFMAAGIGMAISLVLFLIGQRWVVEAEEHKTITASGALADVDPDLQRRRNTALLLFFGINVLFWMAFKQNGNTLSIWARDCTNRVPPAWLADLFRSLGLSATLIDKEGRIPAAYQASINPFFVIVLSPVLVLVWGRLRSIGLEPANAGETGPRVPDDRFRVHHHGYRRAQRRRSGAGGGECRNGQRALAHIATGVVCRVRGADGGRTMPQPDGAVAREQARRVTDPGGVDGWVLRLDGTGRLLVGSGGLLLGFVEDSQPILLAAGRLVAAGDVADAGGVPNHRIGASTKRMSRLRRQRRARRRKRLPTTSIP